MTAGYSGGGPHALAVAALLRERRRGGVPRARRTSAPLNSTRAASLRPTGRVSDRWKGIGQDAQAAVAAGSDDGQIDDDLAFTAPWGVNRSHITARAELFQGVDDRFIPLHHADLLDSLLPDAEVHKIPGSGHVAILDELPPWMRRVAGA